MMREKNPCKPRRRHEIIDTVHPICVSSHTTSSLPLYHPTNRFKENDERKKSVKLSHYAQKIGGWLFVVAKLGRKRNQQTALCNVQAKSKMNELPIKTPEHHLQVICRARPARHARLKDRCIKCRVSIFKD
jgi:hypothetical protein